MADDSVAVVSQGIPGPTQTTLIKTFSVKDMTGATTEVQAVSLVGQQGELVLPLTETTGREILAALQSINNILSDLSGAGIKLG